MITVDFSIAWATVTFWVLMYLAVGYVVMLSLNLWQISHMSRAKDDPVGDKYRRNKQIKSLWWSAVWSWAFPYAVIVEFIDSHTTKKANEIWDRQRDADKEFESSY